MGLVRGRGCRRRCRVACHRRDVVARKGHGPHAWTAQPVDLGRAGFAGAGLRSSADGADGARQPRLSVVDRGGWLCRDQGSLHLRNPHRQRISATGATHCAVGRAQRPHRYSPRRQTQFQGGGGFDSGYPERRVERQLGLCTVH